MATFRTKVLFTGKSENIIALTLVRHMVKGEWKVNIAYCYPHAPAEQVPSESAAEAFDELKIEINTWCSKNGANLWTY